MVEFPFLLSYQTKSLRIFLVLSSLNLFGFLWIFLSVSCSILFPFLFAEKIFKKGREKFNKFEFFSWKNWKFGLQKIVTFVCSNFRAGELSEPFEGIVFF